MSYMIPVFTAIRGWATARDLHGNERAHPQMTKLSEEAGELAAGIARGDKDKIKDSIGDCVVVLTIMAMQHGMTIEECIEHSYEEIAFRTGKTVNGIFIKDGDNGPADPEPLPAFDEGNLVR